MTLRRGWSDFEQWGRVIGPRFSRWDIFICFSLPGQISVKDTTAHHDMNPALHRLDALAKLLDNQFRIPGTNLRFGLDGLIGLVPYVGDLAGLLVSGFLMRTMLQNGASPLLMLRVMGNYALDTLVGIIPIAGDLFDFGFKANRRNVELLKKYYASDKPRPSAKGSLLVLSLFFLALFVLLIWGVWALAAWAWAAVVG
jgi:hypothetical protein